MIFSSILWQTRQGVYESANEIKGTFIFFLSTNGLVPSVKVDDTEYDVSNFEKWNGNKSGNEYVKNNQKNCIN